MKQFFIIFILICVIILIKTCSNINEGFSADSGPTNYNIMFDDNNEKPIKLHNISHTTEEDGIEGLRLNGTYSYIELPNMTRSPYTISMLVYLNSLSEKTPLISLVVFQSISKTEN